MELPYLIFIALGFAASIVSAIFGFGTALIVLSIGSYILPIKETIALAAVLFTASTLVKTVLFGRHIDWKLTIMMSIASVPFAYLGALFLSDLPGEFLKRALGATTLIYLVMTHFRWFPKMKIGTKGLLLGSAAYGFVSGLLGSGNIIKAVIFREMDISKEAFIGAMAATSVLANVAKMNTYYQVGLLDPGLVVPMVCLVFAAIFAVLIGRFLLRDITASQFQTGLQVVLVVSAIGLLL